LVALRIVLPEMRRAAHELQRPGAGQHVHDVARELISIGQQRAIVRCADCQALPVMLLSEPG
jgi:hypothetical protein